LLFLNGIISFFFYLESVAVGLGRVLEVVLASRLDDWIVRRLEVVEADALRELCLGLEVLLDAVTEDLDKIAGELAVRNLLALLDDLLQTGNDEVGKDISGDLSGVLDSNL